MDSRMKPERDDEEGAPAQVLLIDPDPRSRQQLSALLGSWGHRVHAGGEARLIERALTARIDLLLIDPSEPGGGGWSQLHGVRARSRLPILVMLAGDDAFDRVLALESGADAVMAKPINERELKARVRGFLSRREASPGTASICFGRWRLDAQTRRLSGPNGFSTALSPAEYRLLRAFLERPQSVLGRQELLDMARGAGVEVLERSIDLLISRLRAKLDDDARSPRLIRTVRGIGYLFDDSIR